MGTGLDKGYGVLKCRAVGRKLEREDTVSPHYQVHVKDDKYDYRLAINVRSVQEPFDLWYFLDTDFKHPITDELVKLNFGFHQIKASEQKAGGIALDYIRGNLFDVKKMKPMPFDAEGPDNDLNDLIDLYIQQAIANPQAAIYAFGEPWGPENKNDKVFGFNPGRGVHNIHMNQGSTGSFGKENGVYQDGALLIYLPSTLPSQSQWIAGFFAFQSQVFHTDDRTGEPLPQEPGTEPLPLDPTTPEVDAAVRIVAALVNPTGNDPGKESITLINASPDPVDLSGWALADRLKRKRPLEGILAPGASVTVPLSGSDVQLSNDGGIITLLNPNGIKIDGVSYTKEQVKKQGWTTVF